MYLRRTSRTNKNGTVVEYLQLAHNVRHPVTGRSTPRIIYNFGRTDKLDMGQMERLCHAFAGICGLTVINPEQGEGQRLIASAVGLPDGLKLLRTFDYGAILGIQSLWKHLGMDKSFIDICGGGNSKLHERAIFAMVANRLCDPESKLGVWDRWLRKVWLPDCSDLKLRHMYDAMDIFHKNAPEIEKDIFFSVANLFNLTVDLIFYDTTTASFAVDYEDDENDQFVHMRKRGRNKDGTWSPQVVIALAVTRDGLPVRCWVFPSNTNDTTTIERVRKDLSGWDLGRAMFIADAGINSEASREELARACGKYILACRMASVAEIKKDVLSKRGPYTTLKDNLQVKEVIIGDGMRRKRYILCFNPKEARRQARHRKQTIEMLEKELASHPKQDPKAQWAIDLLASRRFKRYLTVTKSGRIRIDRSKIKQAERYDGKWVLETNDDTISVEDAARGYKGLMVIERCFRSLKRTQIKMTPMYHWASRRIEAHVRICVLALLIERSAELMCGEPWHRIKRKLDAIKVTEFNNSDYRFFCRNELLATTTNILKKLNIKPPKQLLHYENIT